MNPRDTLKLSVVIVTCDRCSLFRRTILSIQTALPPDSEVVVLLNGGNPESKVFLGNLSDERFRWQSIAQQPRCQARNLAIGLAQGEIVYVLDDDVVVPKDLFERAIKRFEEDPSIGVLGGPNLTPSDCSWPGTLFGAAMMSPWVAPKVRLRYGAKSPARFEASEHHLILCNLAMRRSVFLDSVGFLPSLKSNEENVLLFQLAQTGTRIEFDSSLYIYHERRKTLAAFLQQIRSYGTGRGEQTFVIPKSLAWPFLVPPLSIIAGTLLLFFCRDVLAGLLLIHQITALGFALSSSEIRKLRGGVFFFPLLTLLIHVVYGIGFCEGWSGRLVSFCKLPRIFTPMEPA